MNMSLTSGDIQSIKEVVGEVVGEIFDVRIAIFEENLKIQIENGLQEIRDQVNDIRDIVNRTERVQQAELERNDKQDTDIKKIRKALHAA